MGKFDGILLVTDFDGTIARHGIISKENREAVEYFKSNGGLFTYATGRTPDFINQMELKANTDVIVINGTMICDYETGEALHKFTMPGDAIEIARDFASACDLKSIHVHSEISIEYENPVPSDFDEFDKNIYKIVFVFKDSAKIPEVKKIFASKYKDYEFERSWPEGLEVRKRIAGKGHCLTILKERTGAKLTIAAGDYENDISMLRAADIGYAPADALPEAAASADRIGVPFDEHLMAHIISELEEGKLL